MKKCFANGSRAMGKNFAVLTVVCLLLCFSFNYTFPLLKDTTALITTPLDNHSQPQSLKNIKQDRNDVGIVDRTKKMAVNLENALRKFIDSTPNKIKGKCYHAKNGLVDSDLSNYEQLVIMKKYPFLDLQELDLNLRSLSKNTGQNLNSAPVISGQDTSFCEAVDESPSVEIINRGLSGFALPSKVYKADNPVVEKANSAQVKSTSSQSKSEKSLKKEDFDLRLIESLEEDIKLFEQQMIGLIS